MPKSIIWSSRAEREYLSIISYWNNRNQSTEYSEKLIREVQKKEKYVLKNAATLAAIYNGELRRVLVFRHYSIIYKLRKMTSTWYHFGITVKIPRT